MRKARIKIYSYCCPELNIEGYGWLLIDGNGQTVVDGGGGYISETIARGAAIRAKRLMAEVEIEK